MSDEERKRQGRPTGSPGLRKIEARPKAWLVPVILLTIREGRSHGYELMERAPNLGFGATGSGTVYRTLRRMEGEGLCESRWEANGDGPARRMYAITDAGEAYLNSWAEALERYQQVMDGFFRSYGAVGKRPPHASERGEAPS